MLSLGTAFVNTTADDPTWYNYNNLSASSGLNTIQINSLNTKNISRYGTRTENMLNGVGMDYDLNIYGDAVYETSNEAYRYDGTSWTGKSAGSWYGSYAGLFYFYFSNGGASVYYSFRPVLFFLK